MSTASFTARVAPFIVVAALTWATVSARSQNAPAPPESPDRPGEQTFLTFPEWFLVFSPHEYATFIAQRPASRFPFLGHVRQFWQGYREVSAATRHGYPPNPGYHVMIMVIGASTSVEYAIKGAYEVCVGRITEAVRGASPTDEDRLAARVAREYVDFIRMRPWYEFDFTRPLRQVWSQLLPREPLSLRAWERRYALTTEYAAKALYARLITAATQASYAPAVSSTRVLLDDPGGETLARIDGLRVVSRGSEGVLADLPRYEAFMAPASWLARNQVGFREIAGNRGRILLSVIVPSWGLRRAEPGDGYEVLFEQPILTDAARKRLVIVTSVPHLGQTLRALDQPTTLLEHIYDY